MEFHANVAEKFLWVSVEFDAVAKKDVPCTICEARPESFQRAFYQLYTIGAVLCTVYYEPLLQKDHPTRPPDFLARSEDYISGYTKKAFRSDEIGYLLRFPAYQFDSHRELGDIYQPLAEYLIGSMGNQNQHSPTDSLLSENRECNGHMEACKRQIEDYFTYFKDHEDINRAAAIFRVLKKLLLTSDLLAPHLESVNRALLKVESRGRKRIEKSIVIPHGKFRPVELGTLNTSEHDRWECVLDTVGSDITEEFLRMLCVPINTLIDAFWGQSGQPDTIRYDEWDELLPGPKFGLQFFELMLEKYPGMRIFEVAYGDLTWGAWGWWLIQKRPFSDDLISTLKDILRQIKMQMDTF
ncbi:hypothetical protein BDV19DRAFT_393530 [Aspergillus venezuelensis]